MKKLKFLALSAVVATMVASCQKEEITDTTTVESVTLTKAQQDALILAGVNPENAEITDINFLDGTSKKMIKSGDILLNPNLEDLAKQALSIDSETGNKQFRTNNLVTGVNRTVDILGFTGAGNALTSKMQTALQWAVNNYNSLGNSLIFRLTFGTNFEAADMVVFNNNQGGGGGSAGFPSGGRPNKFIQINAGTDSFSTNVVEHVITHEIGHSVGFRHQDWTSRQSCGQNSNEGTAGVGAIQIGSTPTSDTADSIMLACFGPNEDGEFTSTDIQALNILY
ncbi:M57 family metalloprotease [uncultured Aquimarina sp.]|uniref:M57 family metalloprotease n=1 Tax=uncultured Aquimarina sp. TaxID=575652 RepID=UPI00262FEF0A|nr:M57 family metalloprotease [uncultured Aquimarina sp.]